MPELEISRMLTVSTAHICENTADMLNKEPNNNLTGLTVYAKIGSGETFGWFVYYEKNHLGKYQNIPDDLANVLKLAAENDASIICFDCDGPTIPELPVFDWEN